MYSKGEWLRHAAKGLLLLVIGTLSVACGSESEERPEAYVEASASAITQQSADSCGQPKEGCACSVPGEIVDCGRVTVKVDDYETCFEGSRLCDATGTWGACVPDQDIVARIR